MCCDTLVFALAPKPKIYTGIVKYRGQLEQKYNSRIYVGVRLDEPGIVLCKNKK